MSATDQNQTISNEKAKDILDNLQHARITLEYIQGRVTKREFINPVETPQLTICVLTLDNGFSAAGKSAPASPNNFNAELGQKYAYDNAIKELWPAFGFALCEALHAPDGIYLKGLGGDVQRAAPTE